MASNNTEEPTAMERKSLPALPDKAVKTASVPPLPAQDEVLLLAVAALALRRTCSQKAAAIDMGLSEGRLSTKLTDGSLTLKQLSKLGPKYLSELRRALIEHAMESPGAPFERRILESAISYLQELKRFLELKIA